MENIIKYKYNIIRDNEKIAEANSLYEAEMLKQKLQKKDINKWAIYELKMQ